MFKKNPTKHVCSLFASFQTFTLIIFLSMKPLFTQP